MSDFVVVGSHLPWNVRTVPVTPVSNLGKLHITLPKTVKLLYLLLSSHFVESLRNQLSTIGQKQLLRVCNFQCQIQALIKTLYTIVQTPCRCFTAKNLHYKSKFMHCKFNGYHLGPKWIVNLPYHSPPGQQRDGLLSKIEKYVSSSVQGPYVVV